MSISVFPCLIIESIFLILGYFYDELTEKCVMEPDECIQKCSHSCGPNGICICPKGYILNPDNNLECIRKRKRKKKKKISGCPEYNSTSTSGIQISYTKDLNTSTLLYPRGTTVKGKCLSGYKNSGKLKKRCKKDGSWRGSDLNCTLITCPAITNLEAGNKENSILQNLMIIQIFSYRTLGLYIRHFPLFI